MAHWLVKEEPTKYAFDQLLEEGKVVWTGVRNYQARNYLKAMHVGDWVLYYHTGKQKSIVGIARVSRMAFADPTASEGDWVAVELEPVRRLKRSVSLQEIRQQPELQEMKLLRQARLSVMPLTQQEFDRIVQMSEQV